MDALTKNEQFLRLARELIERLRRFTTPEICDGAGLYHSMDYRIKPWIGRTKIVGPAVTVDVPSGEGSIVSDAISELQEGDVLVIAGKSATATAPIGEITAASARHFYRRQREL
ncbi:MAG: hypothetical protein ACLTF6_01295 [Clostridium sp.]